MTLPPLLSLGLLSGLTATCRGVACWCAIWGSSTGGCCIWACCRDDAGEGGRAAVKCWHPIRPCPGSRPLHRLEGKPEPGFHVGLDAQHPGHKCLALQASIIVRRRMDAAAFVMY